MDISPKAVSTVVVYCVFTIVAGLVIGLRLGTRMVLTKNLGAEDYLVVGSMFGSVGLCVAVMFQVQFGLGRMITPEELPSFFEALWATIPVYNLGIVLCKLSITVQCYRVFRTPATQRFFKMYFALVGTYGVIAILGSTFACWPIEFSWASSRGVTGTCIDKSVFNFTMSIINIITDLVLVSVPLSLLRKLQIPRRQKYILLGVFGAGLVATVVSIVRLESLWMIETAPQEMRTTMGVNIAIWSCVEVNVAIICASIPALKPLAVKVFPKMLLSDIYAKTKRSHHTTGTRAGSGSGSGSSGDAGSSRSASSAMAEIVIEQSFEMKSALSTPLESKVRHEGRGGESGRIPLVDQTSWRVDCYAGPDLERGY